MYLTMGLATGLWCPRKQVFFSFFFFFPFWDFQNELYDELSFLSAGLNRCGKSCRLRWTNYLRPDLKHDNFTPQEEELIINLHKAVGSRLVYCSSYVCFFPFSIVSFLFFFIIWFRFPCEQMGSQRKWLNFEFHHCI